MLKSIFLIEKPVLSGFLKIISVQKQLHFCYSFDAYQEIKDQKSSPPHTYF